jgi:DNA-binding NtrC family response regulator
MKQPQVLIIDDEPNFVSSMIFGLSAHGIPARGAASAAEGLQEARARATDLVILDHKLPDDMGINLIPQLRAGGADIVMVSAHGDIPTAVEAVKRGALDFLIKPFDLDDLVGVVRRSVRGAPALSSAPAPASAAASAEAVCEPDATTVVVARSSARVVLLLGPSGSGKGYTALRIHELSIRAVRPFVVVNCAALPSDLLESELFGAERGAFTGAHASRMGLIEAAEGGTLFLDEIAETALPFQAKLLGFLESRRYRRLGSSEEREADIRVIAATNRDLEKDIAEGRFRLDLFYRLNVVPITLPRLADHAADVMPLARHFAALAAAANQAPPIGFAPAAEASLLAHDWPGNIRELSNLVERLTILYPGEQVEPHHLPQAFCRDTCAASGPMEARLEKTERDIHEHALRAAGGHKARAAEGLGISRHALKRRLKRLGML